MSTASCDEMSGVRFIPSAVISKIHERIAEGTKPSARNRTTAFIIHAGASNVGRKIDAAWISSHDTTA
jgi:hypothetical protein